MPQNEIEATAPADDSTMIDALAADATPREFPPDAPGLWPYLRLPFRQRAKFFAIYRRLQDAQAELTANEKRRKRGRPSNEAVLDQATALYEMYALMDDLMEIAAVDKDAYRLWVDTHSDEEFASLFAVYVERSQPGEASGSAS